MGCMHPMHPMRKFKFMAVRISEYQENHVVDRYLRFRVSTVLYYL